jgi:hypothetical protein
MSQFVSSFVMRLFRAASVSGLKARCTARLPVDISLADLRQVGRGGRQSLTGFTCDLSGAGLSFITPRVVIGERHIFCEGGAVLRLGLQLPDGTVEMKVRPVRYDSAGGDGQGYVVGAHILEMSEPDRASYLRFLREQAHTRRGADAKVGLRYARASTVRRGVDRLAPLP